MNPYHPVASDVDLDKLDFDYVRSCASVKELGKIIRVLEHEPYPQLLQCARDRMAQIAPAKVKDSRPSPAELEEALSEVRAWTSSLKSQDEHLRTSAPSSASSSAPSSSSAYLPPVRGTESKDHEAKERDVHDPALVVRLALREKDKGNEAFKAKEYDEAVKYYSSSLDYARDGVVLTNRATAFIKLDKFSQAISDCDEAIAMQPGYFKAWWRRGQARQQLQQYELAVQDLEQALSLSPSHTGVRQAIDECRALAPYLASPSSSSSSSRKAAKQPTPSSASISSSSSSSASFKLKTQRSQPVKKAGILIEEVDSDDDEAADAPQPAPPSSSSSASSSSSTSVSSSLRRMQIVEDEDEDEDDEDEKAEQSSSSQPDVSQQIEQLKVKGNDEFKAGRVSKAREFYSEGVTMAQKLIQDKQALNLTVVHLYTNRALCYLREKKFNEAEIDASKALDMLEKGGDSLVSERAKALFRRGLARQALGGAKLQLAVDDLKEAVKLQPTQASKTELYRTQSRLLSSVAAADYKPSKDEVMVDLGAPVGK